MTRTRILDRRQPHIDGTDCLPELAAHNATLTYFDGDRASNAVAGASLVIPARGFYGVMGPSGSGKSSLLYLLSGLKRTTSGNILFGDTSYQQADDATLADLRRRHFGFVFQQPFLFGYLTAVENVAAAASLGDPSAAETAYELLDRLGIGELAGKLPHQLSGGERQRVCVARAMVNHPSVIFADEPTASLDHANGHSVIDLLAEYREHGTVIVVTHDPEMVTGTDRVYRMRDGAIVE